MVPEILQPNIIMLPSGWAQWAVSKPSGVCLPRDLVTEAELDLAAPLPRWLCYPSSTHVPSLPSDAKSVGHPNLTYREKTWAEKAFCLCVLSWVFIIATKHWSIQRTINRNDHSSTGINRLEGCWFGKHRIQSTCRESEDTEGGKTRRGELLGVSSRSYLPHTQRCGKSILDAGKSECQNHVGIWGTERGLKQRCRA